MAESEPEELSASEARAQISEVISRVAFGGERVIISRNGNARVAIVSIADLERLRALDREQAMKSVAALRSSSNRRGTAALSEDEVASEISEARKSRRSSRR